MSKMAKSLWANNLCLPKICWTQNIGVNLELKENLELECGPAQPNLFSHFVQLRNKYNEKFRPHTV